MPVRGPAILNATNAMGKPGLNARIAMEKEKSNVVFATVMGAAAVQAEPVSANAARVKAKSLAGTAMRTVIGNAPSVEAMG